MISKETNEVLSSCSTWSGAERYSELLLTSPWLHECGLVLPTVRNHGELLSFVNFICIQQPSGPVWALVDMLSGADMSPESSQRFASMQKRVKPLMDSEAPSSSHLHYSRTHDVPSVAMSGGCLATSEPVVEGDSMPPPVPILLPPPRVTTVPEVSKTTGSSHPSEGQSNWEQSPI